MNTDTIIVSANPSGHEGEFTVNIPGYSHETSYIPAPLHARVTVAVEALFYDYLFDSSVWVENRGSRLEVVTSALRTEDDAFVHDLLDKVSSTIQDTVNTHLGTRYALTTRFYAWRKPEAPKRTCEVCGESKTLKEIITGPCGAELKRRRAAHA